MTPYDAGMAIVIVAGMVWGAIRGITWQIASMASLVLGYVVAQPLSGQLAPHLPGEPIVARALSMIVIYFATSGGVFAGAWLIRATLRRLQFEAWDRHLGMMLGGVEGLLLGLVVTLFVVSLAPATRDPIFASPTGRVVGKLMATLGPVLPDEARGVLAPFWGGHTAASSETALAAPETPAPRPAPAPTPASAPVPSPSPARAIRRAQTAEAAAPPAPARAPASTSASNASRPSRDTAAVPASFRELLERSEQQIGKAVIDGATEGLKRAAQGGDANGRK